MKNTAESELIEIDYDDFVLTTFNKFQEYFLNKAKLNYNGNQYDIVVNTNDLEFDSKPRIFWHICSLGEENGLYFDSFKKRLKFSVFPCINHISSTFCPFKCNLEDRNIKLRDNRVPCVYRMSKIDNLKKTVGLFNEKSDLIKWWVKIEKSQGNGKTKKMLKVRYTEDLEDYVIMFEFRYADSGKTLIKMFQFVTAYQIFDNNTKERFDNEYNEFISKKHQ
jgi:hypothetical protein